MDYMQRKRRALMGGNSEWLLADGLNASNIIAAYLFVGNGNPGQAIAGWSNYPLTLSGASYTSAGLKVNSGSSGADNATLDSQPIRAGIIACTNIINTGSNSEVSPTMLCWPKGSVGNGFGLSSGCRNIWFSGTVEEPEAQSAKNYGASTCDVKNYKYSTTRFTSGVLGGTLGASNIWVNGSAKALATAATGSAWAGCANATARTIGARWDSRVSSGCNTNGFTCQMAVFYDIALTSAQHTAIYQKIKTRLGL